MFSIIIVLVIFIVLFVNKYESGNRDWRTDNVEPRISTEYSGLKSIVDEQKPALEEFKDNTFQLAESGIPIKNLLHFDKQGRKRTAQEIADLCADSDIVFNTDGSSRNVGEIEKIKFMRVLVKHPEYLDWVKSAEARKGNEFELSVPAIYVKTVI